MNHIRSLIDKPNINLVKGNLYELAEDESIVVDTYKVKIPMKQKGKFRYALISEDEGELVED